MLGAAPWVALSCALGAVNAEYGVRAEARTRTTVVSGQQDQSALDLEVVPQGSLTAELKRLRLDLAYNPRLLSMDATRKGDWDVLHRTQGVLTWEVARAWRLSGTFDGSLGTTSFLATPQGQIGVGQPTQFAPTVNKVAYEHLGLAGALRGNLERTVRSNTEVGYTVDGGSNTASQLTFPLIHEVQITQGVDWQATRAGTLAGALLLSRWELRAGPVGETTSVVGRTADIGVATVTWRQRLSPVDTFWLGSGVSSFSARGGQGLPAKSGVRPAGEIGFQHITLYHAVEGQPLSAELAAQLTGPVYGQFPGQVPTRPEPQVGGGPTPGQPASAEPVPGQVPGQIPGQPQGQPASQAPAQPQVRPVAPPRSDQRVFLEQSVVLRVIPGFDRLSGDVSEQLQASGSVTWTPSQPWRFEGTIAVGISPATIRGDSPGVPDKEETASSLMLQARATWRAGRVEISGGLRGLVQEDHRVFRLPIKQWGLFLGAGFSDHARP